jgi:hypothetical protein
MDGVEARLKAVKRLSHARKAGNSEMPPGAQAATAVAMRHAAWRSSHSRNGLAGRHGQFPGTSIRQRGRKGAPGVV